MIQSDYLILGAGASGLMLAYRMAKDPFFDQKRIVIVDRDSSKGNDRTWCFWERGKGEWDDIVCKHWAKIYFGSPEFSETLSAPSYRYKMIRSEDFYRILWKEIRTKNNISFYQDSIIDIKDASDRVNVQGQKQTYEAQKVFTSITDTKTYMEQKRYPVLQQHFIGWFIRTETPEFDDLVATFMDFELPQKGNTRFMYVLPISPTEALFEYTLFSEHLLPDNEYEEAIRTYLEKRGIHKYTIIEREQGSIPMTSYPFARHNTKNIVHIGTAGGWTKASTGYTFWHTHIHTDRLIPFLKQQSDLTQFDQPSRFRWYDQLFLDVLYHHNGEGSRIFSHMFRRARLVTIFRFLNEESTLWEDLKIILSVPPRRFIQAFMRYCFTLFR